MKKTSDIYSFLDKIAPFDAAREGDNCGLLIGGWNGNVTHALLTLDITHEVLEEARSKGAELIISHHPVIYHPLRKLPGDGIAYGLAAAGIAAICAHTNLDVASEGVNDVYMESIGLRKIGTIEETDGCVALAMCPEELSCVCDLARHIKKVLGIVSVRICDAGKPVSKAAVCCGGGASFFDAVAASKADVFITGDLKYSQAVDAKRSGLSLIDVPHYDSERVILDPLAKKLRKAFPDVHFEVAENDGSCFKFI